MKIANSRAESPKRVSVAKTTAIEADIDAASLLVLLMKHHKRDTGEVCDEPLSQQEIENALQWSQSRVSRNFKKLFKDVPGYRGVSPMKCYRGLCGSGKIEYELIRLWARWMDPKQQWEKTKNNLDAYADRNY